MSFDLSKLLASLETGVQFVEALAPQLAALTPYGDVVVTATKAIEAVTETVENIQTRIQEGEIVAHSTSQDQVRQLAQRLHDLNDSLAQQIDKT